MLLSNVGVNLLVVPAGIFFLSFSKWYVVANKALSRVRLRILFSYLEWDTAGLDAMLPGQENLIYPERMSCSASFAASAGFHVGWAAMQHAAVSANVKMDTIFIDVT